MTISASVEFNPVVEEIEAIHRVIGPMSEQGEWTPDVTYQIELILEELCINVINHGEPDGSKPIKVEIACDEDLITIHILDNGKQFDPTSDVGTPEKVQSIEESTIGGWGVHLARVFSDEMHYQRIDNMNHLTLVKRRSG